MRAATLRPPLCTQIQHSFPICIPHSPCCCRLVSDEDPWADDSTFLAEVMIATYEHRRSQVWAWARLYVSGKQAPGQSSQ
jgi:hypothetical protein